ncbi:uncharacterized protein PAC_00216 [Phialocephala subalpina]|uniref:Uncharacterized protein n=1 Tax=Phialocephala subalpina TaxID=576137 RepID=A0A1L7WC46_9HELO|nr:uncharacterized protein PAC_00216 [Phialocephala subalpina]
MCGKGVDQILRAAQRWAVLTPELNERHLMGNDGRIEIAQAFFTDKMDFDVWGALARPVLPVVQVKEVEKHDDPPAPRSLGALNILSTELVEMVVDAVSDLGESDLVALGLTCQGLWELVVHRVQKSYYKKAAPWTGKKIALQGSWSTSLPDSFNEDSFAQKIVDDYEYRINKHVSRSLFIFMEAEGTAPRSPKTREAALMNGMDEHLPQSRVPRRKWKEMWEQLKCPVLFPLDRDWVLRNLTTKEYVSASFTVGVIRVTKLRLVDALLLKIGWTDMPSWSDENIDISQGDWAGHCFDIVTKDVLASEEGFEAWKDVTHDVALKAGKLRGDHQRHADRW